MKKRIVLSISLILVMSMVMSSVSIALTKSTKKIDSNAKYSKPVTVTTVLLQGTDPTDKLPKGTTPENNSYTRLLKEKYNIIQKVLWIVPNDQFDQKLNVTIASGDIPDVAAVRRSQFDMLAKSASIADLSSLYQNYLSNEVKYWLNSDGGKALGASTVKNKLLGIPMYNDVLDYTLLPFIRTDWLKKLNLPEPKTIADLEKIAQAFTTKDPDGNGENDTYGIGLCKDLIYPSDWIYGLTGIFNSYHAYPGIWVKDSSGKVVYGSVQPQMKQPLQKLQDMYKKGIIDPEFGVKDFNKLVEETTAGKVGIVYGQWYLPGWPLQTLKDKDPKSSWKCFENLATDNKKVMSQTEKVAINRFFVVNKNMKNPEAAMKMLNLGYDMTNGADKNKKYGKVVTPEGGFYWQWVPVINRSTVGQLTAKELQAAVPARNPKLLKYATLDSYNQCIEYLNGDNSKWGTYFMSKPDSPLAIIGSLQKNNQIIYNEFYGAPTKTMAQKGATLNAKLSEEFTKIIMGSAPVSNFDKVVSDWKKLGGDQITKEVNDWLKSQK